MRHCIADFLTRKVGAKKTVGFRKTATHIAAKTCRIWHQLRENPHRLFGIHCIRSIEPQSYDAREKVARKVRFR